MIPQDFIHLLLDRTDIVEVVDRYVPLKKKGANYQACCPFHGEKTPSFTVSESKQFYHCFGCGAHGTAISFLMEHAGLGFVEAIKELAARAGLEVPDDGQGARPDDGHRDLLYSAMEAAAQFYRENLKRSDKAVQYLKQRGLTGETAARFNLGYALEEWQGLSKVVADYQSPALEEAGLVISGEGKRYDRFRDRVMFPIRNERGRTIAFGGRVMGSGEPKYLNSPETPLFHKGRELYGIHENRRSIQAAARVVVVEGYMDVVMLSQFGVENAVATLGTAVTPEHVSKLFRMVDDVIFAFDGDNAGRKAAWRALENTLPQLPDGKRATFLFLPEGEDPDSFVQSQGTEAFNALCDSAKPLSEFLFDEMTAQADMTSPEGKVKLVKLIEPHLQKMAQAPLLKRALQSRLAESTGLVNAPRPTSSNPRRQPFTPRASRQIVVQSPYRIVLRGLLQSPARLRLIDSLPKVTNQESQTLDALASVIKEHPEFQARDIIEHFRGRPEETLISEAAASLMEWTDESAVEADFHGAVATLAEQEARARIGLMNQKRPSEMTAQERAQYLEDLLQKKLDHLKPVQTDD